MRLKDKVALITGGNSGIGLATTQLFIAEGAKVVITGRNQDTLDRAAAKFGTAVVALKADVTEAEASEKAVATAIERFGRTRYCIRKRWNLMPTPFGQTASETFENVLRTNVTAAFLTMQAALPHLKRGASMIFNGSVWASAGPPGFSAYAASKGALRSMSRVLASEMAPRGIRVNTVVPGGIRTPLWTPFAPTAEAFSELEARLARGIPFGHFCEAEDIAKAVLYLASDNSSYVTAAELVVDGGYLGAPAGAPIHNT